MSEVVRNIEKADTVVVGAGISGIAAARTFADKDPSRKVIVVELRREKGGRIKTEHGVEHGAEIQHGTTPGFESVLERSKIQKKPFDARASYIYKQGQLVRETGDNTCYRIMQKLIESASEVPEKRRKSTTVSTLINRQYDMHPEWKDLDKTLRKTIASEVGQYPYRISVAALLEPNTFNTDSWRFTEGYSTLVDRMAEGLRIDLNTAIEEIEWSPGKVVLKNCERAYRADNTVITTPIGPLQKGKPRFSPPLPMEKQEAIARLGTGQVWKIILTFRRKFWEEDLGIIETPLKSQVWWPALENDESNAHLMVLIGGEGIDYFKGSKYNAAKRVTRDLRRLFGKPAMELLRRVEVEAWDKEPGIETGYSYLAVGSTPADRAALSKSIDDTLFFAGEATSMTAPATVRGAMESGERAAREILKLSTSPPASSTDISSAPS